VARGPTADPALTPYPAPAEAQVAPHRLARTLHPPQTAGPASTPGRRDPMTAPDRPAPIGPARSREARPDRPDPLTFDASVPLGAANSGLEET